MEQITIRIKDRKKAQTLLNFLKSLDFIESVVERDISTDASANAANEQAFFALAGLWTGRDISLRTLREQAWPYRS